MAAITFGAAPRLTRRASKLQSFLAMISQALDAYVAYRAQKAVPESELRRAAQTIKRLSRSTEKVAQQPAR